MATRLYDVVADIEVGHNVLWFEVYENHGPPEQRAESVVANAETWPWVTGFENYGGHQFPEFEDLCPKCLNEFWIMEAMFRDFDGSSACIDRCCLCGHAQQS